VRSHLFDNPWSAYFIDSLIDLEETVSTLLWCGLKGHAYIDIVSAMGKLALEQICELVNADTPARDLLIKERRCSNRRRNKLTPGLGVRNRKQIVSHRRYEDDIPRSVFKLSRFGAKPLLDELGSDPQLRSGCLQWGVRCIWPVRSAVSANGGWESNIGCHAAASPRPVANHWPLRLCVGELDMRPAADVSVAYLGANQICRVSHVFSNFHHTRLAVWQTGQVLHGRALAGWSPSSAWCTS